MGIVNLLLIQLQINCNKIFITINKNNKNLQYVGFYQRLVSDYF